MFMVLLLVCCNSFAQEATGEKRNALEDKLRRLCQLTQEDYLKERNNIIELAKEGNLMAQLKAISNTPLDWRIGLLAECIAYRIANPEKAILLDKYWSTSGGAGAFSRHGEVRIMPLPDATYSGIVMRCFGQEAFPVIAENLFNICAIKRRTELMRALLDLRDKRSHRIFAVIAKNEMMAMSNRLYALYCLKKTLEGLPPTEVKARSIVVTDNNPLAGVGHSPLPKEIQNLDTSRRFPELTLSGDDKHEIVKMLVGWLKIESKNQLRAMVAWTLSGSDSLSVARLGELIRAERTPLAKAWLVFELANVSAQAKKTPDDLKDSEDTKVIQTILDGEGKPMMPWENK